MAMFAILMVAFNALFGKEAEGSFWKYFMEGGVFVLLILLGNVAEKHGWDTWYGLISKFKKNK